MLAVYDATPLYERSSLGGLEEDVQTVARAWFEHDAHDSIESLVCCLPLTYVQFEPHDRYSGSTRYGMEQLVRTFLLKELHGWEYESALVKYLHQCLSVRKRLDFENVPDQSTLWRTWHQRFEPKLRETIKNSGEEHPHSGRQGQRSCSPLATRAVVSTRAIQRRGTYSAGNTRSC